MMILLSTSLTAAPSGPNSFRIYMVIPPPPPPTAKRWDQIRYLNVRNHLLQLYKAPRNFLRAAITQTDRVNPVSAPPANGRPG